MLSRIYTPEQYKQIKIKATIQRDCNYKYAEALHPSWGFHLSKRLEISSKQTIGLLHNFSLFYECAQLYFVCIYHNKQVMKNSKLMLD